MKGITQLRNGRWQAQRRIEGRVRYLGCYASAEEAAAAYENCLPVTLVASANNVRVCANGKEHIISRDVKLSPAHEDYLLDACVSKGYSSLSEAVAVLVDHYMRKSQR